MSKGLSEGLSEFRWIERDGVRVLQQRHITLTLHQAIKEWKDIPFVEDAKHE